MKLSVGFSKLFPSVLMFGFYFASIGVLTLALKKIDVGVAYAVWAGMGTALITAIGILYLGEPANAIKIVSIGLIIAGVVGLNFGGMVH